MRHRDEISIEIWDVVDVGEDGADRVALADVHVQSDAADPNGIDVALVSKPDAHR